MRDNAHNPAPPTFPPKCRDEGHHWQNYVSRNPFGGRDTDNWACSRCGIKQIAAAWWMKEALKREVKGATHAG